MLTDEQTKNLASIEENKIVLIYPHDAAKIKKIEDSIIERVREKLTDVLSIHFIGASTLGISGQKEVEAYVFFSAEDIPVYLPSFTKLLGDPKTVEKVSVGWTWDEDGYTVKLYLADPKSPAMKEQIAVFDLLKRSPELLSEYEQLKQNMDGKPYRDYQKAKYEFFNRILK